jgi:hypothetical protein
MGTLYGNAIVWWHDPASENRSGGRLLPGHIAMRTCGYYTPSTRDALAWASGGYATMVTPGSRSQTELTVPDRTDWHCEVRGVKVRGDWVDVTRQLARI